jgi:beta-fructofuranosidase
MTALRPDLTATGLRPRVHLTPPAGWMNDPHGVLHIDGRYHLFFQHVPDSLVHATGCHWGHATSPDLLHWEVEPIALSPDGEDEGVWSGCAVIDDNGDPRLFYTSVGPPDVHRGSIRTARTSDAGLATWSKGPIIAGPPSRDVSVFRDPVVLRDGPVWRMLVGQGDTRGIAGVAAYRSDDLETWHHDGLLVSRSFAEEPFTGTAWECPQLVRRTEGLDADVLVFSVWSGDPHHVSASAGTYSDGRFTPGEWQQLTLDGSHYAPTHFTDAEGRPCLFFWVRGVGEPGAWAGAISVPYVVSVQAGRIRLTPHPGLGAARRDPAPGETSAALDIEWSPDRVGSLRLVGTDGVARAVLTLAGGVLTVQTTASDREVVVDHDGPMLRIIADAQVLEVVADGGLVGLPLSEVAGGLVPIANDPKEVAWWHLT